MLLLNESYAEEGWARSAGIALVQGHSPTLTRDVFPGASRLSRWILQTDDGVDDDALPLTHELLAQMLGVRRSSVSEIASKLQSAKLISYIRGKAITDRDSLERHVCECYRAITETAESILKRRS